MFMYDANIFANEYVVANDIAMKSGIPYAETEQNSIHFLSGMVRIKFSSAIPFSPCLVHDFWVIMRTNELESSVASACILYYICTLCAVCSVFVRSSLISD